MARILVVDDAAFLRKALSDALTRAGHEVVAEASTGQEAIDAFVVLRPDVTTLDITMPDMDGVAVLRAILARDPGARVVMCSTLGQEAKVVESIKLGARDFVVKPVEAARVVDVVEAALA